MKPEDVITNLIKLHADYTLLAYRSGYTINQRYSEAIAEAALQFKQPQNTKCISLIEKSQNE
jgi:hypothetical protein